MCSGGGGGRPPEAPPPPPPEKKLELNPERKASATRTLKKVGTRKLQVPLGGASGGSGTGLKV